MCVRAFFRIFCRGHKFCRFSLNSVRWSKFHVAKKLKTKNATIYIVRRKNTHTIKIHIFSVANSPFPTIARKKQLTKRKRENAEKEEINFTHQGGTQTKFTLMKTNEHVHGEVAKAKWSGAGNISCTFLL